MNKTATRGPKKVSKRSMWDAQKGMKRVEMRRTRHEKREATFDSPADEFSRKGLPRI